MPSFFQKCFVFSVYKSYTYFVTYPRCFILFATIINGVVFLLSLADCSVLVCKIQLICLLISIWSHFWTCLLVHIVFFLFLLDSLGVSVYKIMLSTNTGCFTFIFPSGCLVFIFSWPITLARVIVLTRNNKSRHPYLLPDLRGKVLSISPISMLLAVEEILFYS